MFCELFYFNYFILTLSYKNESSTTPKVLKKVLPKMKLKLKYVKKNCQHCEQLRVANAGHDFKVIDVPELCLESSANDDFLHVKGLNLTEAIMEIWHRWLGHGSSAILVHTCREEGVLGMVKRKY